MADYDLAVLLAEERAHLVAPDKSMGLLPDREITRRWDNIPVEHMETIAALVRGYRTRTSPKIEQKTYSGTWRIAFVTTGRTNEQGRPGFIQETLRYGLADSLSDDEARIAPPSEYVPGGGTGKITVTRQWVNLNPRKLHTIQAGRTDTYTDPVIATETYTGTWQNSKTEIGWDMGQGGDGSGIFTETLTFVNTIANIAALAALTPQLRGLKDVDDPFGLANSYTVTTNESDDWTKGIVLTYPALNRASFAAINEITDEDFQDLLVDAITTEHASYEFVNRRLSEETDKTLTLQVAFQYVARPRAWTSKTQVGEDNTSGFDVAREYILKGVSKGNIATALAAANTAESGYVMRAVQVGDAGNGSFNVTSNQRISYGTFTEAAALVVEIRAAAARRGAGLVRVWWRRTSAAKETLITATTGKAVINPTTPGAYTHQYVRIDDNRDGTYDVWQYAEDQTDDATYGWSITGGYFYDVYRVYYRRNGGVNQERQDVFRIFIIQTKSHLAAYRWAGGWVSASTPISAPGITYLGASGTQTRPTNAGTFALVGTPAGSSRVEPTGDGKYRAICICLVALGSWGTEGA